jgi:hypothetical protein
VACVFQARFDELRQGGLLGESAPRFGDSPADGAGFVRE